MLPLQGSWFRIAIVPGATPFLLSSTFLKEIQAVIDTDEGTLWSKKLNRKLVMERSPKSLFLMDLTQLWQPQEETSCLTQTECPISEPKKVPPGVTAKPEGSSCEDEVRDVHQGMKCADSENQVHQISSQPECNPCTKSECTAASGPSVPYRYRSVPCQHPSSSSTDGHVDLSGTVQGAEEEQQADRRSGSAPIHDVGGTGQREGNVWGSQERDVVQQGLRRCPVDRAHPAPIREQHQAGTSNVPSLCGASPQDHEERREGHQQAGNGLGHSRSLKTCGRSCKLPEENQG